MKHSIRWFDGVQELTRHIVKFRMLNSGKCVFVIWDEDEDCNECDIYQGTDPVKAIDYMEATFECTDEIISYIKED